MNNSELKRAAAGATFFAAVAIALMLQRAATRHIMITDAAGTPMERGELTDSYTLLLDESMPQGKENLLIIPLPDSINSDNIVLEDDYTSHELRIYVDSRGEDFYKENAVLTDLDILDAALCFPHNNGDKVCLDFYLDDLYANESTLTECGTIEVRFCKPKEMYDKVVVVDPLTLDESYAAMERAFMAEENGTLAGGSESTEERASQVEGTGSTEESISLVEGNDSFAGTNGSAEESTSLTEGKHPLSKSSGVAKVAKSKKQEDIALETALLLKSMSEAEPENNVKFYLTRLNNNALDPDEKLRLIKDCGADFLIELDGSEAQDNAVRTYYNERFFLRELTNASFADIIERNCAVNAGAGALGVEAGFDRYEILAGARIPSATVSIGATSGHQGDNAYERGLARGIYCGIMEAFQEIE